MDHRGINEQDIEKMMEGAANELTQKEPTKEQTEEEKKLMQEWEQHMHDFVPEDISTIIVDPRKEVVSTYKHVSIYVAQTFYEDIGTESIYIRGAYFVGHSSTSNKLIDFFIVNPKNKVIFSKRKSEEGIFRFNTTMAGRYSFIFSNIKDRKSIKDVTIAIHTPDNEEGD